MRPPQHVIILLIAIAAAMALFPPPARAQTNDVTSIITRNGELLMEATALVRETNSTKARAALEVARKLHESSQSLVASGNRIMAGRTALEAREAILRAIAIARQEVKLEESARRAIERARQRLEQARQAFDEAGQRDDPAPRKLIEEARAQLQRSHDNMQEHMFEIALRLANASSDLSARALQMLRRDGMSPDRLLGELQRTDEVIARALENGASDNALRMLDEARDLQERARESARGDRPRAALEQTRRARNMALRVMQSSEARDGVDEESALRALRVTDEVIQRARDGGGDRGAEAARVQAQARTRLEAGDTGAAMRLTLQARELARGALPETDRPVDAESVRAALARTDATLARLRDALAGEEHAGARDLLERAVRRQRQAHDHFQDEDYRQALALTKVARNLAGNGLRELGKDDG